MLETNRTAPGDAAADIRERIDRYLAHLIAERDVEAAGDFYTRDARVLGPGTDLDRSGVMEVIRSVLEGSVQVRVNRRTLELFVHDDAAYEIAQAEDTFVNPDGTSQTLRNNLFIRWEKGVDGRWRFARVLMSPQGAASGLRHDDREGHGDVSPVA